MLGFRWLSLVGVALLACTACTPVAPDECTESGAECDTSVDLGHESVPDVDAQGREDIEPVDADDVADDGERTGDDGSPPDVGDGSDGPEDVDESDADADADADADIALEVAGGACGTSSPNPCGGCVDLGVGAAAFEEPCGLGERGFPACNGTEAVHCLGDPHPNRCGGAEPLPEDPGDLCGVCGGGAYVCDATAGTLRCEGSEVGVNACGGCRWLSGDPGAPCPGGELRCAVGDPDAVRCVSSREFEGLNGCGGTGELRLDGAEVGGGVAGELGPGRACGPFGRSVYVCVGANEVSCDGEEGPNPCGGWNPLPDLPEAPCGPCAAGVFRCDGPESLACVFADDRPNRCGGCTPLSAEPGTPCGDDGVSVCDGPDAVSCVRSGDDATDRNACGGTVALPAVPGTGCGACDSEWVCTGVDAVTCVLGPAGIERNSCGGCAPIDAFPGSSCGTCFTGNWACDGVDALACEGDLGAEAFNGCGGCMPLPGEPGERCGTCGTGFWECIEADGLFCAGDRGGFARNACGGCGTLVGEPGVDCDACATWRCSGADTVCVFDDGAERCTTCGDLDCGDTARTCVEAGFGAHAKCGRCLPDFVERGGVCVPTE